MKAAALSYTVCQRPLAHNHDIFMCRVCGELRSCSEVDDIVKEVAAEPDRGFPTRHRRPGS
ncbi:hypothetical protein HAX54_020534, partial [Datura stramonium]|nr:hypothetical protein [Datura stramonium]